MKDEQHITINNEGRVWFSGYNFGHGGERYEKARSKNFIIDRVATDRLLGAIVFYFGNAYTEIFATDIGDFVLVPAGKDNHEAVVEVVSIEYFSEDNAMMAIFT